MENLRIYERIVALSKARGETIEETADIIGTTGASVRDYRSHPERKPRPRLLRQLAKLEAEAFPGTTLASQAKQTKELVTGETSGGITGTAPDLSADSKIVEIITKDMISQITNSLNNLKDTLAGKLDTIAEKQDKVTEGQQRILRLLGARDPVRTIRNVKK